MILLTGKKKSNEQGREGWGWDHIVNDSGLDLAKWISFHSKMQGGAGEDYVIEERVTL